jgi:chemotaxis protein methyltransferase CheR
VTDSIWSDAGFELVARVVGTRTGLSFPAASRMRAEAGIARAMARAGLADLACYGSLIQTRAEALDDLVIELTVGETYFFREPAQFSFIRHTVLPEIRARRGPRHAIRTWSAGCASGEEAYSLAIMLGELSPGEHADVWATDISRAALAKARAASYGAWSLRGEGAWLAGRYLRRDGARWVVDERIRRRVRFEPLNLALDAYPSCASGIWGMDLILCRNVLIYFDPDTVLQVARRFYESLAAGGWLITGPSDPSLVGGTPYETVATDAGTFYRRGAVGRREPSSFANLPAVPPPPAISGFLARAAEPAPNALAPLEEARLAFARGDYHTAVRLTRDLESAAAVVLLRVRALANLDSTEAERVCAAALEHHPFSPELHYLLALLLLDQGRDAEAAKSVRRVLYLDRSLAAAHLTLGTILRRLGERDSARRAYRNAYKLCVARPADEVVPLTEGERAGRLSEAAEAELALLEATAGRV